MKKIFLIGFCLFSLPAFALDHTCIPHIEKLEKELQKCTVEYGDDASVADMNNATYNSANCAIQIGHELIKTYYANTEKDSLKQFDNYVVQIYNHSHHLNQESDYAREHYIGTIHNSIAISEAEEMIKNLVKRYLKQLKSECKDATDYKP